MTLQPSNTFQTLDLSLDLVRALREPLVDLLRRDPDLAQQLRRAAASVSLNLAEGNRRAGRDRIHLFRVAAGSADEVRACLRVAEAWGHLGRGEIAPALGLCERVLGALWRLTHPRVSA